MPKSNYLNTAVLNEVFRGVSYTPPSTTYLALFTLAPNASGGGTEVSGGGYARQPITWSAPVTQTVSNSIAVSFPIASAPWGTVVSFGIYDQGTGGNLLYFANLSSSRNILTNDQMNFPVGQLVATES